MPLSRQRDAGRAHSIARLSSSKSIVSTNHREPPRTHALRAATAHRCSPVLRRRLFVVPMDTSYKSLMPCSRAASRAVVPTMRILCDIEPAQPYALDMMDHERRNRVNPVKPSRKGVSAALHRFGLWLLVFTAAVRTSIWHVEAM